MSYPPQLRDVHYDVSKESIIEPLSFVTLRPAPANPGPTNDLWINSTTGHLNRGTFDVETGGGVLANVVRQNELGGAHPNEIVVYDTTSGLFVKDSGILAVSNRDTGGNSIWVTMQPGGTGQGGTAQHNFVFNDTSNMTAGFGGNNECAYFATAGTGGENRTLRLGDQVHHDRAFIAGAQGVTPAGTNDIMLINTASDQLGSIPYETYTHSTIFTGYNNANPPVSQEVLASPVTMELTRIGNMVTLSVQPYLLPLNTGSISFLQTSQAPAVGGVPLPVRFRPLVGRVGVARTGQAGVLPGDINGEMGLLLVGTDGLVAISRSCDLLETPALTFATGLEPWWGASITYNI